MNVCEMKLGEVNFKTAGWKIEIETTLPITPWGTKQSVKIYKHQSNNQDWYSAEWYQNRSHQKINPCSLSEFETKLSNSIVADKLCLKYADEINADIERTKKERAIQSAKTKSLNNETFVNKIIKEIEKLKVISDKTYTAYEFIKATGVDITPTNLGMKCSLVCKSLDIDLKETVDDNGWTVKHYMQDILEIVSFEIIKEEEERRLCNQL